MIEFSVGFVYILTNEAMPGIIKIGRTSRLPEDRANDLWGSALPSQFNVVFRALTSNPERLEKKVHENTSNR
ncbi:GIY-YIG nuclease family protein [Pedobacter miscanthi]|uniref:GIY-YIG nuclease family protein n=1 Tax=Pedobacter miscanthi TaxID=2259170 RepID=UPI00397788A6